MVFINLHRKDGHFGKTGGFCKHKFSSLYNQAVEVIFQEVAVMLMQALSYVPYPNSTGQQEDI